MEKEYVKEKCISCGSARQVGRTELDKIVCYNCFHNVGGFGYVWNIIDERSLDEESFEDRTCLEC